MMSGTVNSFLVAFALVRSVLAYDVHLSVPFTPQVPPGTWKLTNNCGQASVAMVLGFYNHNTPTSQDIIAIDDWLFQQFGDPVNNYNGSQTNTTKLTVLARGYGYFPGAAHYSGWTITDLKKRLNLGHPVIVAVWTHMVVGTRRHFMVLVGMDDSFAYFNDPGLTLGANKQYTISQFVTAWQNQQSTVVSIEPPTVGISTASCVFGPTCTGPQGTEFSFVGTGFSPNATVRRFVEGPTGGTELSPLVADNNGQISWSFSSTCTTAIGTYDVFGIDSVTGILSNKVNETVALGNCAVSPTCTLSANPSAITQGQSSTFTWTTTNTPTSASIDNGVGSVTPPTGGTKNVSPAATITYTLTVTNSAGPGTCSAQVTVNTFTIGGFTPTGNMSTARLNHTASLLSSGKVLIAGGDQGNNVGMATAELYDASTGLFSPAGTMTVERFTHTATVLSGGSKVLIAGGWGKDLFNVNSSAELYDSFAQSFTATVSMQVARNRATAILLNDGRVLIVGGVTVNGLTNTTEMYDPTSGSFLPNPSRMIAARQNPVLTLLQNGNVLVTGGAGYLGALASTEIFDPTTNTFAATGSMNVPRFSHTASLLSNGKVLIAGGDDGASISRTVYSSAEIYDPVAGTFAYTTSMPAPRSVHTATRLSNGQVLIAGGYGVGYLASALVYDVSGASIVTTGSLTTARLLHTATLLPNGQVLIAGGSGGSALASAELYTPGP
jgi:uncharacterized protein YvpB